MLIHHFMDAESEERIPFTPRTGWTPGEDKVPREITEFITGTAWAIRDWLQQRISLTSPEKRWMP